MELENVVNSFQDKTIFITGASGFLATIFVEKILRLQPNVNKLYLLLRSRDDTCATERLYNEIMNKELFRILGDSWGSEFDGFISTKVVAVAGDISFENLGLNESKLREQMLKEIEIVVNVAATTDFYERYDVSLATNTFGAFNILSFAKKCHKIKLFLHVSTAYVCGEQEGIVLEKPFYMGETLSPSCKLDIFEEKRIMEKKLKELRFQDASNKAIGSAMKEIGLERANFHGWPNTYVFTKAMGEMLIQHFKEDLPVIILRPTMIASTYKEPFSGWIEGIRTIDSVIVGYGKGKLTCFPGNPDCVFDVIPADMVVNAMVVAIAVHTNHQSCNTVIYHVSSSIKNPLALKDLHNIMYFYFNKNPWIDRNGKRVKIGKGTVLSTPDSFSLYMTIKYVLLLKVLYLVSIFCKGFRAQYVHLDRKIKFAMRLAEFYKPYVFFKAIFDDTNLKKLQKVAQERGIDGDALNFDSNTIEWEDYIMNIHIPGLLRYGIKS